CFAGHGALAEGSVWFAMTFIRGQYIRSVEGSRTPTQGAVGTTPSRKRPPGRQRRQGQRDGGVKRTTRRTPRPPHRPAPPIPWRLWRPGGPPSHRQFSGRFSSFRYVPGSVGFGTNHPGLPSASRPRRAPGTGGRPASNAVVFALAVGAGKKPLS